MYNHRKLKSSFFLQDDIYPEKILSRHQHHKKSGVYASLKPRSLLAHSSSELVRQSKNKEEPPFSLDKTTRSGNLKNSAMLLEEIPQIYSDHFLYRKENNLYAKVLAENTTQSNSTTESIENRSLLQKEKVSLDQRGLQDVQVSSFTNGLLNSGHRYFRAF